MYVFFLMSGPIIIPKQKRIDRWIPILYNSNLAQSPGVMRFKWVPWVPHPLSPGAWQLYNATREARWRRHAHRWTMTGPPDGWLGGRGGGLWLSGDCLWGISNLQVSKKPRFGISDTRFFFYPRMISCTHVRTICLLERLVSG